MHRRVSIHGLALNVSTRLSDFEAIVPCGLADAGVTSIAALRGEAPPLRAVAERLAAALATHLRRAGPRDSDPSSFAPPPLLDRGIEALLSPTQPLE